MTGHAAVWQEHCRIDMSSDLLIPQMDQDLSEAFSQLASAELKHRRIEMESEAALSLNMLIAHGVSELITRGATDEEIDLAKQNLQSLIQKIADEEMGNEETPLRSIQITTYALQSAFAKLCPVFPFC